MSQTPLTLTQRRLVTQVLAGNQLAAHKLYRLLEPKLRRFFAAKIADSNDIEELVQDTFLHFLDALPLYRAQSSLTTFILSIARHEQADYWRKLYAKRLIRTVPLLNHLVAKPYSSAETAARLHQALEAAYQQLSPDQVTLLRLKYEDNLSVKQIATKLNFTTKSVETKLYRARKAFQAVYQPVSKPAFEEINS